MDHTVFSFAVVGCSGFVQWQNFLVLADVGWCFPCGRGRRGFFGEMVRLLWFVRVWFVFLGGVSHEGADFQGVQVSREVTDSRSKEKYAVERASGRGCRSSRFPGVNRVLPEALWGGKKLREMPCGVERDYADKVSKKEGTWEDKGKFTGRCFLRIHQESVTCLNPQIKGRTSLLLLTRSGLSSFFLAVYRTVIYSR